MKDATQGRDARFSETGTPPTLEQRIRAIADDMRKLKDGIEQLVRGRRDTAECADNATTA